MDMLFRFDKPRLHQDKMMEDIYNAISQRRSIFINAPTGIGKTDASISACLSYALKEELDVFFLTPKTSQHKVAIEVLSGIRKKFNVNVNYIDIVGKRNLCVNPRVNMIEGEPFYKACEDVVKGKRCSFYTKAKETVELGQNFAEAGMSGHNALFAESFGHGLCAYEIAAKLAKKSNFIVADYAHILNPYTRQTFMKKIAHSLERSIIIWDEAHNIVETASSYLSSSLSLQAVEYASRELMSIGSSIDLGYMAFMLEELAKAKIRDGQEGEAFVDKKDLPSTLSDNLEEICDQLEKAGMEYISRSGAKRSSLMHIARFIRALNAENDSTIRIISRRGKAIKLSISCLYPSESIDSIKSAYANVFMSGTLLPLGMHKELLGFPDAHAINYKSPFPKENRICLLDSDVSTKYENRSAEQYNLIASKISKIKERVHGNLAVFFPSFDVLESVYRHMPYEVRFIQRREMRSFAVEKMIRDFKQGEDSLLFAVMGGSLSEGIDYANNVIKGIIIVGIPLEKPNLELNAKIEYLNKRFGMKGNEYAYTIPGIVKAVQASGRAIRSESDRAFIVFMDKRYSWSMYKSIIANFMHIEEGPNYINKISLFMSGSEKMRSEVNK